MTVKIIYIFKTIPSCKRILFGGCMANTINLGGNEKRNKITDVNMTNNKETATSLIFFLGGKDVCVIQQILQKSCIPGGPFPNVVRSMVWTLPAA